ncbi:unnamed protein product [Schistosoma curassoni]|uniref:Thioredoxin-like_fold domain-containing protein n=1 Tax=Schistosoma curassoni TaxID=6186 RepID=A0A183JGE5_9TREM|nr:unnamed protein product [Schistosoma curassoni]
MDAEKPYSEDLLVELSDEKAKSRFQDQLRSQSGISENEAVLDVAWEDMQRAVGIAATPIYGLNRRVTKNQWIYSKSIALIGLRKLIPSGSELNEERKRIKSRLTKSLRNDREQWWATEEKKRWKRRLLYVTQGSSSD